MVSERLLWSAWPSPGSIMTSAAKPSSMRRCRHSPPRGSAAPPPPNRPTVAAGDVVPLPEQGRSTDQFWFGHHIATMIAIAALPGRSCIPYAGEPEMLVEDASRFILRGIGMNDAAITAHIARNPGAVLLNAAAD